VAAAAEATYVGGEGCMRSKRWGRDDCGIGIRRRSRWGKCG
jgi:hypothetical protein